LESIKSQSYWSDSAKLPGFAALTENLEVDVVIVGGGITGVTAAHLFKKRGYRVALLERGQCADVDSACTSAHLTFVTDTRLRELVKTFGKDHARAVWNAGAAAIDQIYSNMRAENIECDFKWIPGYLHAPLGKKSSENSFEEEANLARSLGFTADYQQRIPRFAVPGIRFAHVARFHPLKYIAGLAKAIPGDGSHVFEETAATEFESEPLTVKTEKHKISCRYIVLATHNPIIGNMGLISATLLQTKLALYTSYVIGAKLATGSLEDALFWDTGEPYYYTRLSPGPGFDYLIFGGEDHKTGQKESEKEAFNRLEKVLLRHFPEADPQHRWSGQVIETVDGLPYIGETAERQFVATGFGGNGLTFGTLGAIMAVDAFEKRKNPWSELFAPDRKKLRKAWDYLKENADYPYYLVRDWLGRAEGKSTRDLKRGQGRILNLDGKKVAAYRDEHGELSLCSPVCTHMKCIVAWNDAEKTWDCPCHGSRFKPTGEVLAGPAEEDLAKISTAEKR
jgi:glycine/D-amino acid oxidase-like deaminating enzyme/nitrite reductase/ring-hydroxylating ferredoxin subunit